MHGARGLLFGSGAQSLASLTLGCYSYYYSLKVRAEPAADRTPGVTGKEALQFCGRAGSFSSSAELEAPRSRDWQGGCLQGRGVPWDASGAGGNGQREDRCLEPLFGLRLGRRAAGFAQDSVLSALLCCALALQWPLAWSRSPASAKNQAARAALL